MTSQQKNLKIASLIGAVLALFCLIAGVVQALNAASWEGPWTILATVLCAVSGVCAFVLSARGIKGANIPRLAVKVGTVALVVCALAGVAAVVCLWQLKWLYAIPEVFEAAVAGISKSYAKKVERLT